MRNELITGLDMVGIILRLSVRYQIRYQSYHISTSPMVLLPLLVLVVVFFPPVSLGSWSTFLKNSFWPRYSDSWKLNIWPSTMLKADTSYLNIKSGTLIRESTKGNCPASIQTNKQLIC